MPRTFLSFSFIFPLLSSLLSPIKEIAPLSSFSPLYLMHWPFSSLIYFHIRIMFFNASFLLLFFLCYKYFFLLYIFFPSSLSFLLLNFSLFLLIQITLFHFRLPIIFLSKNKLIIPFSLFLSSLYILVFSL